MDFRDLAATLGQWWHSVDMRAMTATWAGESVAVRFEVCGTCDGRGEYVNPSIDSHGIGREEMDELGEEFMDDYRSGMYNITCATCKGVRVVPVPTDPQVLAELREYQDDAASDARMNRMESGIYN